MENGSILLMTATAVQAGAKQREDSQRGLARSKETDEEDLRRLLVRREEEAAELQSQLLQAATFGRELMTEQERLKSELSAAAVTGGASAVLDRCRWNDAASPRGLRQSSSASSNFWNSSDAVLPTVTQMYSTASSVMEAAHIPTHVPTHVISSASLLPSGQKARLERAATMEALLRDSATEDQNVRLRRRISELHVKLERLKACEVDQERFDRVRSRRATLARVIEGAVLERPEQDHVADLEDRLRDELAAEFQEQLDDLHGKVLSSEAHAGQLRQESRELETAHVGAEAQLAWAKIELARCTREHQEALRALEEQKELLNISQSNRKVRKSVLNLTARFSDVVQRTASRKPRAEANTSLFNEISDHQDEDRKTADALQQENEQLNVAVAELRLQLDQAEKDKLAAGQCGEGCRSLKGSDKPDLAALAVVEPPSPLHVFEQALRAELNQARKDLQGTSQQLRQQRATICPAETAERLAQEAASSAQTPWEKWLSQWRFLVCCREDRAPTHASTRRTAAAAGARARQRRITWPAPQAMVEVFEE